MDTNLETWLEWSMLRADSVDEVEIDCQESSRELASPHDINLQHSKNVVQASENLRMKVGSVKLPSSGPQLLITKKLTIGRFGRLLYRVGLGTQTVLPAAVEVVLVPRAFARHGDAIDR